MNDLLELRKRLRDIFIKGDKCSHESLKRIDDLIEEEIKIIK
jgi:hypothetical protein